MRPPLSSKETALYAPRPDLADFCRVRRTSAEQGWSAAAVGGSDLLSGWWTHGLCISFRFRSCSVAESLCERAAQVSTRVVRSEAERTGQEACQIRQLPRKQRPHPQMRRSTLSVPQDESAPQYQPPGFHRTDINDPRLCPNLTDREGFGHKSVFLLDRRSVKQTCRWHVCSVDPNSYAVRGEPPLVEWGFIPPVPRGGTPSKGGIPWNSTSSASPK